MGLLTCWWWRIGAGQSASVGLKTTRSARSLKQLGISSSPAISIDDDRHHIDACISRTAARFIVEP
jgi:hypothetical protein